MWRTVPNDVERILWEGPLQPATEQAQRDFQRSLGQKRLSGAQEAQLQELPVISIGQPLVWTLAQFCGSAELAAPLAAVAERSDLYVAEFCCNLRPRHDQHKVLWARFWATLQPEGTAQALARDLYPQAVNDVVKHTRKVTLSPTLKFKEVEVSVGSAEFGLEYTQLLPKLSASGFGEAIPSWDLAATEGSPLVGGRTVHALIAAPKGMARCRVTFNLAAEVHVAVLGLSVNTLCRETKPEVSLTTQLWGPDS